MPGVLVLRFDGAQDLVGWYHRRAEALENDVVSLDAKLRDATRFVSGDALAALDRVPGTLGNLGEMLRRDAEDLAWRVAYVESIGADGVPTARLDRSPRWQRMSTTVLLTMLDGDDTAEVLRELAIRALRDDDVSRAIAGRLDGAMIETLRNAVEYPMLEAVYAWQYGDQANQVGWDDNLAAEAEAFDAVFRDYGILLASFSHHDAGRAVLETMFDLDDPGPATDGLPVALLHGHWNADFLNGLAADVFRDNSPFLAGFARDSGALGSTWGSMLFPQLLDSHSVLLRAIARNPDAAREFVFEADGYWTVMDVDNWGGFADPMSRVRPGDELDDSLAEVLRVALLDPAYVDDAYDAMIGTITRDDGDRLNTGLFYAIAEQGIPGDASRQVFVEAFVMQWHNIATATGGPGYTTPGDALAVLFEDETDRNTIVAGFGAYLESSFTRTFAIGDGDDIGSAVDGATRGFQVLDHALDILEPTVEDRGILRRAFSAALGSGVRYGLAQLALPQTWPTAALTLAVTFSTSELGRGAGDHLLADEIATYPSSQSVLEDLFVGGHSIDGGTNPQPAEGAIMLANASLAARPDLAGDIASAPWVGPDGVIVPSDPIERDAFGAWFDESFGSGSPYEALVHDVIIELGVRASVST